MIKTICWSKFWNFFGYGFSSGIPYFWIAMTFPTYVADQHMAQHFSWISLLFLPYTFKPLWALGIEYILHRYHPQRARCLKAVLFASQVGIMSALVYLSHHIHLGGMLLKNLWVWTLILGFFGSIQDIIMEGYRIQASDEQSVLSQYLFGTQTGFRVAGIVMSSGTLCIAHYWSWSYAISVLIGCMGIVTLFTVWTVNFHAMPQAKSSYSTQLRETLHDLFSRSAMPFSFFLHLLSYKVIDGFIRWMWPVFLINQGYSKLELTYADKGLGWLSVVVGGFIAQRVLTNYSIKKSLIGWAFLQTAAYSLMFLQYSVGKHLGVLFINSCIQQTLSGAGNLLIWVYISHYCYGNNVMIKSSIASSVFSLERVGVAWCSSLIYQSVAPHTFFMLGIILCSMFSIIFMYRWRAL